MKITPLDIQQKQFRSVFRGLHQEEVAAFLDMVRIEMEGLVRDNASLKDNNRRLAEDLEDYKERDRAIKDTLMMAQRMTEDIRQGASKEADILMAEARTQAEQIVAAAHDRMLQLVEEINDLKSQRAQTLAELRSTIQTHAKLLEITENQLAARDTLDNQQRFMHSRGNDGTP